MIKLFTDTSANLPANLLKKHSVSVIPFTYTMDGTPMTPRNDFDGKAYYSALRAGSKVNTSMINVETFSECFENELRAGNDVLYIAMSGGISGTAGAAAVAARELNARYSERTVEVIDSKGASLGEGLLVLEAAEMIEGGAEIAETAKYIRSLIPQMCQCFTVEDLRHLKRTGRISGAVALIGGLLGIRPLLIGDNDGKIVMYDKIRGAKRALDALAERYGKLVIDKAKGIGIAHADNDTGAAYLVERLKEKGFCGKNLTVCYEPVTGSHVGPGTIALFFFGKRRVL